MSELFDRLSLIATLAVGVTSATAENIRLSPEDVRVMTKVAIPIWFDFANKGRDAARVFKIQLDYMTSGSLGYIEPEVAELFTLDL